MSERIKMEAEVPAELDHERLDQVAARLFPDFSRSRLQVWIKKGELLVDGKQLRPRDKVAAGALLAIQAEPEQAVSWQPEDIDLDILYEDEHILVLNKPAGLVVHPAAGHADGTLVNALLAHAPQMAQLPRGGIVHRLDMETSGIMVAAKSLLAHHDLVAQLQARTVKRQYTAVCIGVMTGGGTVDEPIGRHPRQRKKMAVLAAGGKPAITHYRVIRRFGHHTCISVSLETGRTHQIRVHMAHRHYPLVGDPVYGGRPRIPKGASDELVTALRQFPRQALHAQALGLFHPESGEAMEFECPLPADMQQLLATLEREDPANEHDAALY
ncbi:23S rRNA pseudouridine(1911/1915/1917) synthase RluD [Pseudohalioglobus sediminis]|uniref:Pseudouridine synthase n=1 Tax=Pseudohalioglobus sediminis TaxID=2606449 RepID=A0A5B0WMP7_9GAMM|nr:23S rRNA pseudouridine(1911/1915/1917) synthase RluD [Pseudohalioglobus sediminis]KAA1188340.1 23S rRNA pseudouridine(1911/1915/1917) synthase RluD [Pseudohalioglobus sediminis]